MTTNIPQSYYVSVIIMNSSRLLYTKQMRSLFVFFQVTLILRTQQRSVLTSVTNTMKCHHVLMNDVHSCLPISCVFNDYSVNQPSVYYR